MNTFIEDEEKIEAMMQNMLYYEQQWLPKFAESIRPYNELKVGKYFIGKTELRTKEARKEKYTPDPLLKNKVRPF